MTFKQSRHVKTTSRNRFFRPGLEELENRLAPASLRLVTDPVVQPPSAFDRSSGTLSLLGSPTGSSVEITSTGSGNISIKYNSQLYTTQAGSSSYDSSLAGLSLATLRTINLSGGGAGDTLTIDPVASSGNLTVSSDGSVVIAGGVSVAGQLTVSGNSITVAGSTQARVISMVSTGLLDVAATGSLLAQSAVNGGSIRLTANSFDNVGQVRADGSHGGQVTISANDYLNTGTLSAVGTAGPGGTIGVTFGASYIDTVGAITSASGSKGAGGQIVVESSTGRLFSSGHFTSTGSSGGSIELLGQSIALVAASIDASATSSSGGKIRIGGDAHGATLGVPDAQTVNVTGADFNLRDRQRLIERWKHCRLVGANHNVRRLDFGSKHRQWRWGVHRSLVARDAHLQRLGKCRQGWLASLGSQVYRHQLDGRYCSAV